MVTIESIPYRGWSDCYRLTNGDVELIAASQIGPRILRYAFVSGQNMFYECRDQMGGGGEPTWQIRGGHRLWRAPEIKPDTYALDNSPVTVTQTAADTITLLGPVEPETGLQKEISVSMSETGAIQATHRITNRGTQPVQFAVWPATLLAPGGLAFVALPSRGTHEENLLPTNPLVMWAYTDFSDPRWHFTTKYITLRQDPNATTPQKAGLFNEKTFAAYILNGQMFTKRCDAFLNVPYAEFHCSFQIFTNRDFLELETLAPLKDVAPGESASHVEHWSLHKDVHLPSLSDRELDRCAQLVEC